RIVTNQCGSYKLLAHKRFDNVIRSETDNSHLYSNGVNISSTLNILLFNVVAQLIEEMMHALIMLPEGGGGGGGC
ncbi:hypothetical protein ACJX0J_021623, partial [Zea mays]